MHGSEIQHVLAPFLPEYEVCTVMQSGYKKDVFCLLKHSLPLLNTFSTGEQGCFILFGLSWRVLFVYALNKGIDRKLFFRKIWQHFYCDKICVLFGDFHCV